MASQRKATFRVTNRHAPRLAVDHDIGRRAAVLKDDAAELTPRRTGRLASSWQVTRKGPAEYALTTDVPYAKYVEYGTKDMPPAAMLGRALAKVRHRR